MRYNRDNKTLRLNYYADMNDAPISDLLRKFSIKTENHFMNFSGSSWQDYPDTGRGTGAYITFFQGGPIYHGTHVPRPIYQLSTKSEYNASCTSVIALARLSMLIMNFWTRLNI